MVLHTHYFKAALCALVLSVAFGAHAAGDDQEFFNFLADKQSQLERQAGTAAVPVFQPSQQDMADAAQIAERTRNISLKATGGDKTPGKYQQFKTLVFITFGIPEKTLRALFRQAAGSKDIGFVLRGISSPDIYREIKRVRGMMSGEGEAIVFVDPLLFRNYHVDRAPFTLHKARDGRWYGLWGEIAIAGARERIERGLGGRNRDPVGPLYAIKEPDMQEQMRKKFDSADWSKMAEKAKSRAKQAEIDVPLPPAPKDRVRLVDVSAKLMRDVVGPNGEVLATAGTVINPLEHVSLDERYVIFDPTSRFEAEVVARWRKQYPAITLIATHWDNQLGSKFDVPVFVLDPLLKRRFQIEYSPSLVEQEGVKIKVTELRPQNIKVPVPAPADRKTQP